jgi:hypothetical protein
MPRRAVLAAVAVAALLGGATAPALAATAGPTDPTHLCVLTSYDPTTGHREGVCVWLPVGGPPGAAQH